MMESFALKFILIVVLAFVAHDINIVSLAKQKAHELKYFRLNPVESIQKIYHSLFIH